MEDLLLFLASGVIAAYVAFKIKLEDEKSIKKLQKTAEAIGLIVLFLVKWAAAFWAFGCYMLLCFKLMKIISGAQFNFFVFMVLMLVPAVFVPVVISKISELWKRKNER